MQRNSSELAALFGVGVGGELERERFDAGSDGGSEQGGEFDVFDAVMALAGRQETGVGSAGVEIDLVVRRCYLPQNIECVVCGHIAGLVAAIDLIADEKRPASTALAGL